MHHCWIQVDPYSSSELETVSSALHLNMDPTAIRRIVQLRYQFDVVIAHGAAVLLAENKDSLVLSLPKIKHVCPSFMLDHERQVVES